MDLQPFWFLFSFKMAAGFMTLLLQSRKGRTYLTYAYYIRKTDKNLIGC